MQAADLPTCPMPSARAVGRSRSRSAKDFQARARLSLRCDLPIEEAGVAARPGTGDKSHPVLGGVPGLGSWKVPSVMLRHHAPWSAQGMLQLFPLLSMSFSEFAATQKGTGNSAGGTRRGQSAQLAPFGTRGVELSGLMLTHSSASAAPNYS